MKIDTGTRELIAVGASRYRELPAVPSISCGKALESGADDREVATAVAVAKAVRKGAAAKMDDFASGLGAGAAAGNQEPDRGCGCGG